MSRRHLLIALGIGILGRPLASVAQRTAQVRRIGFLGTAFASGYVRELDWIRASLRDRGYVEGRNIVIETRWAEGNPARNREIAREFVALKVDAILVHGLPGALAAAAETATIPIVMADGGDPVAAGITTSIARPSRNVTGSFSFVVEEVGKRLELLAESFPRMKRVAFLVSTLDLFTDRKRAVLRPAAQSRNLELHEFIIREAADLPSAFKEMTKAQIDGVIVNNEPLLNSNAGTVAALAAAMRLPSVGYATYGDAGGLLAYGANRVALYGRAGYFLDRIFKGEKPGDIPFERASRFDVTVNVRTAKALGVTLPQSILLRADRAIE